MGIDEKEPEEGDQIFESNGVKVVVDPQSLSYMDGSLVSWVDEPDNQGFSIENPNPAPQKECNCGGGCAHGGAAHRPALPDRLRQRRADGRHDNLGAGRCARAGTRPRTAWKSCCCRLAASNWLSRAW